jgi:hypothetical protein
MKQGIEAEERAAAALPGYLIRLGKSLDESDLHNRFKFVSDVYETGLEESQEFPANTGSVDRNIAFSDTAEPTPERLIACAWENKGLSGEKSPKEAKEGLPLMMRGSSEPLLTLYTGG